MKSIREALHSREVAKYIFVIPGLCFFIFAVALPFVRGIHVSFTDWDGVSMTSASVGISNYIKAFHDKRMLIPLRNTMIFGLLGTIGNTAVSLSLAMLLNKKMGKLTTVARTAAFTPVCFSAILTSFLWGFMREFAMTLAATNGGPGQASKTLSIYIYENLYKFHKAGYGQAVAIIFCVLLMLIANAVSSFFRKGEVEM